MPRKKKTIEEENEMKKDEIADNEMKKDEIADNEMKKENLIEIVKIPLETSEIKPEKKELKKKEKKTTKTIKKSAKESTIKGDTTLIITEKPQAAEKIAYALSDSSKKYSENGVSYYEFEKYGRKFIVGCAVGHLFGISEKENYVKNENGRKVKKIPNFDVEWVPAFKGKSAFTKKYYDMLKKLAKDSNEFIIATDYDVEGEVIGLNVIRYLCNQKDAKRMKFSSLTKEELNESFEHLSPNLNWGLAIAGETRHYLDWFYGINLSRVLMKSLSKAGGFRIMSIGRVQGPSLSILVDKELQIKNFKPEPYWQVFLQVQDFNNQKIEVKFPKDLAKKTELLKFKQLKGKKGNAKTEINEEKINPPAPFDLTTLQTEAYSFFGLTPTQTLQIAQKLYLEGIISYPRTSSQKLPEAIGYEKIFKQLGKNFSFTKYAVNKNPVEGKKSDSAHPAIYPTGEFRNLEGRDKDLYELIVRRFVSCFCNPAVFVNKKITVSVDGLDFYAKGLKIKEKNWLNVYKSEYKEGDLPTINGEVIIKELRIEEKMTQPPKRYTEASLVKELEKRNLGTKSTRASIIETLYSRGYVKERSIEATPLGMKLVETLKKYSPIILDEELTRNIEKDMEAMETAKKDLDKKQEKVIENSKEVITKIVNSMIVNEDKIGKELSEGNKEMWEKEREENILNQCPVCKQGNLRILFNRNARRYFVACDKYPNCKTTFSLPPNSLIKPSIKDNEKEKCPSCSFPMLLAIRKGKRPWKFCFNPQCETRKEHEEKKAENES